MSTALFTHARTWLKERLGSFLPAVPHPPHLPENYNAADYQRFMREETFLLLPQYAKRRVVMHGGEKLGEITSRHGAILAPIHYGSFFLGMGAVVHQLKLPCTPVVTNRNLLVLPPEEEAFWRGVHQRSAALYGQPLFYSSITPPREMMRYLAKPNNLLLAMLDVREAGGVAREYPITFLQRQIFLQTGPARLARLTGVPLIPTNIQYNLQERRHHMHFGSPVWPEKDPVAMTQKVIAQLEQYVHEQTAQFFHDLHKEFATPHR